MGDLSSMEDWLANVFPLCPVLTEKTLGIEDCDTLTLQVCYSLYCSNRTRIMHIHVYVVYMDCVRYIVACICCTQRYYTMYSTHDTSPLPCNVNYYQCNLELSIFIYTCMSIIFVEMLLWELVSLCMYIYMHSVTMHKMQ